MEEKIEVNFKENEKIKVDFKNIKIDKVEFDFGKKKELHIEVIPYISAIHEIVLIQNYVDSYFKENDFVKNYISAENGNILGTLDLYTNIDITNMTIEDVDIIRSGLWIWVKKRIINYEQFEKDLQKVIAQMNIEKSIGNSFDKMSNAVVQFLSKVSEMDLSSEGINKLIGEIKQVSNDYETKFLDKEPIQETEEIKE
jgi:hypothetical protein